MTLLLAAAMLVAGPAVGITAIEDEICSPLKIARPSSGRMETLPCCTPTSSPTSSLALRTFPPKKWFEFDAKTLRYDGITYKLLTEENSELADERRRRAAVHRSACLPEPEPAVPERLISKQALRGFGLSLPAVPLLPHSSSRSRMSASCACRTGLRQVRLASDDRIVLP